MGIDLKGLLPQIQGAVGRLKEKGRERRERRDLSLSLFSSLSPYLDRIKTKIARGKTTWLVAGIEEGWDKTYPLPPLPKDYAVLGVDGSHIPPDEDSPALCYLINLGFAYLQYGKEPKAVLANKPLLFFEEKDLAVTDTLTGRELAIDGLLLGIRRSVEEARFLAQLIEERQFPFPTLAIMDGSLILWGLAGKAYPPFIRSFFLDQGLFPALEAIRKRRKQTPLALAGYISFPHSTEVVNVLRLYLCPYDIPNCDRYCRGKELKECDGVAGVEDREIFAKILKIGERSSVFLSKSSVLLHYGESQIYFFYVKLPDEVARVEVPRWVAKEKDLLDLTHSVIFEQSRLGMGYPVVLMEAHQKASLSPTEREGFWALIEENLAREGLLSSLSPKKRSKRMPLA